MKTIKNPCRKIGLAYSGELTCNPYANYKKGTYNLMSREACDLWQFNGSDWVRVVNRPDRFYFIARGAVYKVDLSTHKIRFIENSNCLILNLSDKLYYSYTCSKLVPISCYGGGSKEILSVQNGSVSGSISTEEGSAINKTLAQSGISGRIDFDTTTKTPTFTFAKDLGPVTIYHDGLPSTIPIFIPIIGYTNVTVNNDDFCLFPAPVFNDNLGIFTPTVDGIYNFKIIIPYTTISPSTGSGNNINVIVSTPIPSGVVPQFINVSVPYFLLVANSYVSQESAFLIDAKPVPTFYYQSIIPPAPLALFPIFTVEFDSVCYLKKGTPVRLYFSFDTSFPLNLFRPFLVPNGVSFVVNLLMKC